MARGGQNPLQRTRHGPYFGMMDCSRIERIRQKKRNAVFVKKSCPLEQIARRRAGPGFGQLCIDFHGFLQRCDHLAAFGLFE